MLNRITVMGRLTRDPELRQTQRGISAASFAIACDRDFRSDSGEKITDFFDVTCWRKTADFAHKWFRKGQLVALSGRVQLRKWTDREGRERVSTEIAADEAYFAEKREDSPPVPMPPSVKPAAEQYGFQEINDDDDLPFL